MLTYDEREKARRITRAAQIAMEVQGGFVEPPEELRRLLRPELPSGWELKKQGMDGAAYYHRNQRLAVITSIGLELDGQWWLHVSASRPKRVPDWQDMCWVKDIFIGKNRKAIQVMPSEEFYVNLNPYVLHLWCCLGEDRLPEFSRGLGTI